MAFFGTPTWAVPTLEALLASEAEVAAVVTNPDRPAGRGMKLTPSPVKAVALAANLEVRQPERARDPELAAWLSSLELDAVVVVAYGKILPLSLLTIPRRGFLNVHFSLLPRYRGAAPVQRAVMEGETKTGVAVMVLTEGMDEGPVLAASPLAIGPDETAGEVGDRLAAIGGPLLVDCLRGYLDGTLTPTPQDDAAATYAPKIGDEEARVDWARDAVTIKNLVRGLNPMPGAWTTLRGRRLKLHRVAVASGPALAPGKLDLLDGALVAGTGGGSVELVEVQMAGRQRMGGAELARGLRSSAGETLE